MESKRPLRALVLGCGGIAAAWLKPLAGFADCEIVGLVDLKLEQAEKRKLEFSLSSARAFDSLDDALAVLKPDLVFNLTVPSAHKETTLKALAHGCHVLCEKPLASNMAEARAMLKAARRAGRVLSIIQNRRYLDAIVRFRDFLRSGAIGDLHTLHADFYIGAHFGGFRELMEHVLLLDMAVHSFDQARFLSGWNPLNVYACEWNPAGSWYKHGASACAVFEMEGGGVFSYRGSWCAEGFNSSWECDWRAIGSSGTALWDGGAKLSAQRPAKREGFVSPLEEIAVPEAKPLAFAGHAGVIREFLDCVRSGSEPQTNCFDNVKSFAMVQAAIKSASSGKRQPVKF